MAADGATSPTRGAPSGGDGVEDEDDADRLPLSAIFPVVGKVHSCDSPSELSTEPKSVEKKKPPATADGGGGTAPEGGGGNIFGTRLFFSGNGGGGSPRGRRGSLAPGDIVWAKAFPYTWWPGWVREMWGSLCLVSLFGGDKSHSQWIEEANIREFEGNYVRMSKMGGTRLAYEVDCALAELSRRTVLGMACTFLSVLGSEDEHLTKQIAREKERFEPVELVEFVLSKSVCPWVDDGEIICVVRGAAQVCAYRNYASVVRMREESEGFDPGEVLGIVRGLGVSAWVGDEGGGGVRRVVGQLEAYRRFMYRCPDWSSANLMEEVDEGDSSTSEDSEGSHLEMPFRSLSEFEEADDLEFLCETDTEEQEEADSEVMQPVVEFCMLNRIDYSIFDTEFECPCDGRMENHHNWGEEKGMASDTEKTCVVSPLNKEHHSWNCKLIHGPVSSVSGQVSSLSRDTSERVQEDEFFVVNEVNDQSSVSADSNDDDNNMSKVSYRYASPLDSFLVQQFDQTFASITSIEMGKASDFSLTDASIPWSPQSRTGNSSQFSVEITLKPQLNIAAGTFRCEKDSLQLLREMLYYLHCLASDPLDMRSESLLPLCQLLLSYRASMFKNICDLSSIICTEASQKAEEHDVCGHHNLVSDSGDKHHDGKASAMCEHSSTEGVLFHKSDEGIELQSSSECHSNGHMPHDSGDSITINTASRTAMHKNDTAGIIESNAERRLSGKIVVDRRYAAAHDVVVKGVSCSTFPVNHNCEVVTKRRRFGQEATSMTSSNLCAANSLGSDVKAYTLSMMLGNKDSNDGRAFYGKQSDMSNETEVFLEDNSSYEALTLKSNSDFCAAAGSSSNSSIKSTALACSSALQKSCRYEVSSCRKRRPDNPVYSYVSTWQKNCRFTSAMRLYASPLVKDSSSATGTAQCSSVISRETGPSSSLHMKFPKGFILPSKEDLEKVFGIFGPLDHTRTRIFFYTGAGMVVFLNPVDAETAYNYVRRNEVFETGVRFWLDPHERLRKVSSPRAFSLFREQASKLGLKSCLKSSNIHKKEHTRKKCRVRFSTQTHVCFLQQ